MTKEEGKFAAPERPDAPADDGWLTLDELCDAAAESRRTVRFYILNGLLSAPVGAGPAARYPRGHLPRLRLVRALQAEGMQLSRIRELLEGASDEDVIERLGRANEPPPEPLHKPGHLLGQSRPGQTWPPPKTSEIGTHDQATGLVRSQWDHVVLEPGVELHVRRPLSVAANRRVQKLLEFAQKLLASQKNQGGEP